MRFVLTRAAAGLAVAALLLGVSGPLRAPAAAAGTGVAVIVSPGGETVPWGWTGPITVDFSDAETAKYVVTVECDSTPAVFEYTTGADTTTVDFTFDPGYFAVSGGQLLLRLGA